LSQLEAGIAAGPMKIADIIMWLYFHFIIKKGDTVCQAKMQNRLLGVLVSSVELPLPTLVIRFCERLYFKYELFPRKYSNKQFA
jgi:hypothetical protein